VSKKWYNYFVSVDEQQQAQAAGDPDSGESAEISAARTVADIAASIAQQPPAPLAPQVPAATGILPESFDEIYATAGIVPPVHGYTAQKVSAMLQSQHIRNLPLEVRRSSVLVALDAAGVKVQDIIEDAVRRDRALDAFERVRQRSVDQLEAQKAQENQQLQAELDKLIADYRGRIQKNNEAVAQEKGKFLAWLEKKKQEEDRIAEAISPFVTENPISRGPAGAAKPPTA